MPSKTNIYTSAPGGRVAAKRRHHLAIDGDFLFNAQFVRVVIELNRKEYENV